MWRFDRPGAERRAWLRVALTGAATVWLAGCASLLSPPPREDRPPEVWSGRFALTVEPNDAAPEGRHDTGNFELTAGRHFTELQLMSPLGNTIASARSDANGAVLKTSDGRSYQAASVEDLTRQVFGWSLPVDRLPDWLRGRIARVTQSAPVADLPTAGPLPLEGTDQGWQVRLSQWQAVTPSASGADPASAGGSTATASIQPQRLLISYPQRVQLRLVVSPR